MTHRIPADPVQTDATHTDPVQNAVAVYGRGQAVLLVDDRGDETHGAILVAAVHADAAAVNLMVTHARGLVCLGIPSERASALGLARIPRRGGFPGAAEYTVSIEAATGVTTGISASDRARTIEVAIDPQSGPADVVSPGHLFPVCAHPGGVLVVGGAAEAAVDLARLAGCRHEAGAFCQVLAESGELANGEELVACAAALGLPLLSLRDLVRHRMLRECHVREVDSGHLDTEHGRFDVSVWENVLDKSRHVLLRRGAAEPAPGQAAPLVRVHSECLTGDIFGSRRCDCGPQLHLALGAVAEAGQGAVLYLRQEGRGSGLVAKLRAYQLQDQGLDTVQANEELGFGPDLRDYGIGAQILVQAGYRAVRLLTNNPRKVRGLSAFGLHVTERVPLQAPSTPENARYLQTKKLKLGHLLDHV